MPKKGYKTITVKESVYNYFKEQWEKRKHELEVQGISSFSAFITHELNRLLEQEKKQNQK
jgi:predicted CopG family antitoxin